MTNLSKGKTVDTTNLQPREIIHTDFPLYNVTSVQLFNSILTVVCAKDIILWLFITEYKIYPVQIIQYILIALNNEQHPCKNVRVDEDKA